MIISQAQVFDNINVEIAPLIPFLNIPQDQKRLAQDDINRKQQEIKKAEQRRSTKEHLEYLLTSL